MKKSTIAFLTLSLLATLSISAQAAAYTWTAGGDGASWSVGTNWGQAGTTPYPGSTGTIDTATFTEAATITALGNNLSLGSITLNTGGNVLLTADTTHTITLSSLNAINIGAGQSLSMNSTVFTGTKNTGNIITEGTGSNLTFSTGTITTGTTSLVFSGGNTTINSSILFGNVAQTTTGNALNVSSGTLTINSGTITGTLTSGNAGFVSSGGVLNLGVSESKRTQINGNGGAIYLTNKNITVSGNFQAFIGTSTAYTQTIGMNFAGTGSATISSGINFNNSNPLGGGATYNLFAASNNILYMTGANSGSFTTPSTGTLAFVKQGAGTIVLSNANTFTGTMTVQAGTLSLINNAALQDATLATGGGGVISLASTVGVTGTATAPVIGGLSGSQNLNQQITTNYSTMTSLTLQPQAGVSAAYSGAIADGATPLALTIGGTGTQTFSGASTYTGGTTVNSGASFFINNNPAGNASATGSGPLTVQAGAIFGGTGAAVATGNPSNTFAIGATGSLATVYVGQASASDTNTTSALTLQASTSTASTIQNTNLVFNLDSTQANVGNELSVGNTKLAFNVTSGVADVTLTANLEGANIISPGTTYVLVAGTAGGAGLGQYSGFTVDANNIISGLTLAFAGSQPPAWYANSYLVLVNNGSNVDDIDLVVVPEPGTWAMMLGGLALLVFVQRRRLARSGDDTRKGRKI